MIEMRNITIITGFVMITVMLSMVCLFWHYAETRPIAAQQQVGRVYPLNIHGRVVYLTRPEHIGVDLLEATAVVCIALFSLCILILKHRETARLSS